MSRVFKTRQNNIVIPTKELIKMKGTDFKMLAIMSILSGVANNTKSGGNTRYLNHKRFNSNMKLICNILDMKVGQVLRLVRDLINRNTQEFYIVEREENGEMQYYYEISYEKGGFVNVPYERLETLVTELDSNCIKLYCNLLWLCVEDGEFVERQVTQPHLLELMGLSRKSIKIIKSTTDKLLEYGFINIRRDWIVDTEFRNGVPVTTTPKEVLYYSINFED